MLVADAAARRQERDEARQELDLIKMRAADHAREVGSVIENATLPLEERIRHLEGPPAGDADGAPFGEHALEGACDCCICDAGARGSKRFELCTRCGAAYDRWQRSQDEDGTIWGVMVLGGPEGRTSRAQKGEAPQTHSGGHRGATRRERARRQASRSQTSCYRSRRAKD